MLAEVVIYTAMMCSYCDRAKDLLKNKGIQYQEISIVSSVKAREEMIQRSGGRKTVPQIFINGKHIGGFDDLRALDSSGKLDQKLGKNQAAAAAAPRANKPLNPPKPKERSTDPLLDNLQEVKGTGKKTEPGPDGEV